MQTDKIAIVTGASAGIGWETTRILASKGAEVVMAVRNVTKGEAVANAIRAEHADAKLHVMALDLSKLGSVRSFAAEFLDSFERLDVLINNAGIYDNGKGLKTTEDGFALMMGVNHLGHFALTRLLLERLLSTPHSRVVTVSSGVHRGGKIDLDNFHTVEAAKGGAYGNSKLANMLFMLELQRRLTLINANTISVGVSPGPTKTDGAQQGIQSISNRFIRGAANSFTDLIMLTSEEGALPVLRAATDPQVKGGEYYSPGGFMSMRGAPGVKTPAQSAKNPALAQGLWERSAELTAVSYDLLQSQHAAEFA